jgi:hypothetical protein
MQLSVIIPTHNPDRARLQRVLHALAAQEGANFPWEVIIVDNASSPPVDLATLAGPMPPGCRVVVEPQLGLTYARETGMREMRGELWLSVDDDNVLAPTYVATAVAYMAARPDVGALGGRIAPELAAPAPDWLVGNEHSWRLALRDFGSEPLVTQIHAQPLPTYPYFAPIGAGMVLRRRGIERYLNWALTASTRLSDRKGGHLGTCGDSELVMQAALLAGEEVAYHPGLQMLHVIPAGRLRYRYLLRLAYQGAKTWAEFQCRYGFDRPVSRWLALARCARAFFFHVALTPDRFLRWTDTCGYQLGLARRS